MRQVASNEALGPSFAGPFLERAHAPESTAYFQRVAAPIPITARDFTGRLPSGALFRIRVRVCRAAREKQKGVASPEVALHNCGEEKETTPKRGVAGAAIAPKAAARQLLQVAFCQLTATYPHDVLPCAPFTLEDRHTRVRGV